VWRAGLHAWGQRAEACVPPDTRRSLRLGQAQAGRPIVAICSDATVTPGQRAVTRLHGPPVNAPT
jgi:hypothetical protein